MSGPARIREALLDDAAGIARCHVRGWQQAYVGILPQERLDALDVEDSTRRRRRMLAEPRHPALRNWVAEQDGRILGWASAGPSRDEDLEPEGNWELYAIYLDPQEVGRGHGRALMQHVLDYACEQGALSMTMWVLEGNARAQRFYAAAGFRPDERVAAEGFLDTGASKLRMRRELP